MRYEADKAAHPTLFANNQIPMSRYVRQLYKSTIDPNTGVISYNPDPVRDAWEAKLKDKNYRLKKPGKQLNPMTLWRMWIFKPVYDCFVYIGGDPGGNPIIVNAKPMSSDPEFKSLLVGQQAYKDIFTDWLIEKYKEAHNGLTQPQIDAIKSQKEFKQRIKDLVWMRLDANNIVHAWQEVYEFLVVAAREILGLPANTFTFNLPAIRTRYATLLAEFRARESPRNDLTYTNLDEQALDYSPAHWIPGGDPQAYLTAYNQAHPPKHRIWRDHTGNILTGAHQRYLVAQQVAQQAAAQAQQAAAQAAVARQQAEALQGPKDTTGSQLEYVSPPDVHAGG
jgi:hypothetical protein